VDFLWRRGEIDFGVMGVNHAVAFTETQDWIKWLMPSDHNEMDLIHKRFIFCLEFFVRPNILGNGQWDCWIWEVDVNLFEEEQLSRGSGHARSTDKTGRANKASCFWNHQRNHRHWSRSSLDVEVMDSDAWCHSLWEKIGATMTGSILTTA
jgi:hypothetical protein